jgi:hypothetical protein
MNKLLVVISLLIVAALACGTAGAVSEPKAAVAPITLAADLTAIDLCQAMPRENIEAVLGRALVETPERFEFYDASGTSGCAYSAGKGSDGAAYFGYIALTPAEVYENQPLLGSQRQSRRERAVVRGLGRAVSRLGRDGQRLSGTRLPGANLHSVWASMSSARPSSSSPSQGCARAARRRAARSEAWISSLWPFGSTK